MKETIPCEEITILRDLDGTIRIVGESRERGSIILVSGPGYPIWTNDSKKQPKLFT